jgi:hypothetical protein
MLEKIGNIFEQDDANAICFTSNGIVKSNGELVMGAGIAKAFKERWPWLPKRGGDHIKRFGNCIGVLGYVQKSDTIYCFGDIPEEDKTYILNFPTKHHWKNPSSLKLIENSAEGLVFSVNFNKWNKIYLPRPGCGLGGLSWEKDVKPVIAPLLDDRFIVLSEK